jgi:hypothetical protein
VVNAAIIHDPNTGSVVGFAVWEIENYSTQPGNQVCFPHLSSESRLPSEHCSPRPPSLLRIPPLRLLHYAVPVSGKGTGSTLFCVAALLLSRSARQQRMGRRWSFSADGSSANKMNELVVRGVQNDIRNSLHNVITCFQSILRDVGASSRSIAPPRAVGLLLWRGWLGALKSCRVPSVRPPPQSHAHTHTIACTSSIITYLLLSCANCLAHRIEIQMSDTPAMREIKEDISESVVQAKKAQASFEELFLVIKLIEGRMNSSGLR